MKIDNKGWGLNTMIIMVAVILIALLLATFFSIRLNSQLNKENNESENQLQETLNNSYYSTRINNMIIATNKYINKNDISLTSTPVVISLKTLVSENYMSPIMDGVTNNACVGYSRAYLNDSGIKEIKAYLKCDNYISEGYGES